MSFYGFIAWKKYCIQKTETVSIYNEQSTMSTSKDTSWREKNINLLTINTTNIIMVSGHTNGLNSNCICFWAFGMWFWFCFALFSVLTLVFQIRKIVPKKAVLCVRIVYNKWNRSVLYLFAYRWHWKIWPKNKRIYVNWCVCCVDGVFSLFFYFIYIHAMCKRQTKNVVCLPMCTE